MVRKVWLPLPLLLLLACPVRPLNQEGVGQIRANNRFEDAEEIYYSLYVHRDFVPREHVIRMLQFFRPYFQHPHFAMLHTDPVLKELPSLLTSSSSNCVGEQADKIFQALRITEMKYKNLKKVVSDAVLMHRRECENVWLEKFANFESESPEDLRNVLDLYHQVRDTSPSPPETFGRRLAVKLLKGRIPHDQEVEGAEELVRKVQSACLHFVRSVGRYIDGASKLAEEGTNFYNFNVILWVKYLDACLIVTAKDYAKAIKSVAEPRVRPS